MANTCIYIFPILRIDDSLSEEEEEVFVGEQATVDEGDKSVTPVTVSLVISLRDNMDGLGRALKTVQVQILIGKRCMQIIKSCQALIGIRTTIMFD